MPVRNIAKVERFFRASSGLDIDKSDVKRYEDFVNRKIGDLLIRAQAVAKANDRDIVMPFDLPISKGLQESIQAFRDIDGDIGLEPVLDDFVARPQLDVACSDEVDGIIGEIAGGLSIALARSFKIIEPDLKNPQSEHWERSYRIFDLLV